MNQPINDIESLLTLYNIDRDYNTVLSTKVLEKRPQIASMKETTVHQDTNQVTTQSNKD